MKRLIGLLFTILGAVAVFWGGYHILSGESTAQMKFTETVAVTALMSSLIGVTMFSLGLLWVRD